MNAPVKSTDSRLNLKLWQHQDLENGKRVSVLNLIATSLVSARHPAGYLAEYITGDPERYLGMWKTSSMEGVNRVFVIAKIQYDVRIQCDVDPSKELVIRHVCYLSYSQFYNKWSSGMVPLDSTCGKNFYVVVMR